MPAQPKVVEKMLCAHCGDPCITAGIRLEEKNFCCEGCKMVYQLINEYSLCEYYNLNDAPGITQRVTLRKDKFAFLDDAAIASKLISFRDGEQVHVTLYLPQMHCSSCLYLLENSHRLDEGIRNAKVNFTRKEVTIVFMEKETTLRKVVEMLARIGYEPYISLNDLSGHRPAINKKMIAQMGLAGFCFGNIMLFSFPEYLGIDASDAGLRSVFRWASFTLALPVFFYSALPFYESSWKSLKHRFLNIDTPIALAIIITFIRSVWEVFSGTGAGFFDSMSGIVFFMLAGRVLQDKTYQMLSFERDYTSYFPVAVSVLKDEQQIPTVLPAIKPGDTLLIHNEELVPADGILTKGKAFIDYSFVTGESMPVMKEMGELVYAGGKQTGGNIEILVMKEVAQSYLTSLWSREEDNKDKKEHVSFVHILSRYFTYIVFIIAGLTALYWKMHDPVRIWQAVTAIFIIACPCALLLSNSFTNGNMLRILGRNHFYLRNAQTIEDIAKVTHIVFDKTGTLTSPLEQEIIYEGNPLSQLQKQKVAAIAACSTHPLSRALAKQLPFAGGIEVLAFKEIPGEGIEGIAGGDFVKLGSSQFIIGEKEVRLETAVFISFENNLYGSFRFSNHYRNDIPTLIKDLQKNYRVSVLTGDNESEEKNLREILGKDSVILFHQKPENKLAYILQLQKMGENVMMIGDGLNDAGALKQSDTGIAVTEGNNNFTPASDAILDAAAFSKFTRFIRLCRDNRKIVMASFLMSIIYNIIGLYFAVQGNLSPLIAAILMPSSSLCILLVTFGSSNQLAKRMKI